MNRAAIADQIAKDIMNMAEQDKCLVKDRIITRVMEILALVVSTDVAKDGSAPRDRDASDIQSDPFLREFYKKIETDERIVAAEVERQRVLADMMERYRKQAEGRIRTTPVRVVETYANQAVSTQIAANQAAVSFAQPLLSQCLQNLPHLSLPVPAHPSANQAVHSSIVGNQVATASSSSGNLHGVSSSN